MSRSPNVTPKASKKNKEEEKKGSKSGKTSPPLSKSPKSKKKGNDDISGIDKGEVGLKKDKSSKPVLLDIESKPDVRTFYVEWLINQMHLFKLYYWREIPFEYLENDEV